MNSVVVGLSLLVSLFSVQQQVHALGSATANLASLNDFVILSNKDEAEVDVYVYYASKHFNKCGIAFRTHAIGGADDLKGILTIQTGSNNDAGEIRDNQLVAIMQHPEITGAGVYFKIKTLSGRSLKSTISELNPTDDDTAVIVQIEPCK